MPARRTATARPRPRRAASKAPAGKRTLAIDVGGTGLKASVLDERGEMVTERVRVETPHPCNPALLLDTLVALVEPLPAYDRISVGFPGLVRFGVVVTAPNLGTEAFAGFELGRALGKRLGKPCRVVNDADMQGLAVIEGKGVEMVITLGTGFGTALFSQGHLQTHLEIAHHPFRDGQTYDDVIGERGRKRSGNKQWRKHVAEAIANMRVMVNFDRLYVGGGNARRLRDDLGPHVQRIDNSAGILGGIRLWDQSPDV